MTLHPAHVEAALLDHVAKINKHTEDLRRLNTWVAAIDDRLRLVRNELRPATDLADLRAAVAKAIADLREIHDAPIAGCVAKYWRTRDVADDLERLLKLLEVNR